MPVTQKDIDDLEAAKFSGARKIRFTDGREVEYRDLDEINQAIASMKRELSGSRREPHRPTYKRGYQE